MPHSPRNSLPRALSILSAIGDVKTLPFDESMPTEHPKEIQEEFVLRALEVSGRTVLLACFRGGRELDWMTMASLADSTSVLYDTVIVAAEDLQVRDRLALMAAGLSYIVVDRETYIPDFGVNTSAREPNAAPAGYLFAPATQAFLTYALLHGSAQCEVYSSLCELAIPLKQVGLVAHELSLAGVAAVSRKGLRAYVELDECRVAWAVAEPFLASPVIDTLRIFPRDLERIGKMRISGEEAFPWSSSAGPTPTRRLAIHQRLVKSLKKSLVPDHAAKFTEVEVWNRCPAKLCPQSSRIDPISLYLCRRGHATVAELCRLQRAIGDIWQPPS